MKSESESSLKSLKHKNRHLVLECIRQSGAVSMADVARKTGLSKMTIHYIVEHLLEAGLVIQAGKGESTDEGGKKPKLFAFNSSYRFIFSVRIVEQELLAALTNLRGEIIASHTALYGKDTGLDEILRLVREAFNSLVRRRKLTPDECLGAVVGCHGVCDAERGICLLSPHFTSWGVNVPIRDMVERELPDNIPVFIDNWLRYLAYGEMKARTDDVRRFFLMGTEYDGVAGGLVIDGTIYHGDSGLSGEVGHMVVNPGDEVECACGGFGCFEVAVSPKRLEEKAWRMRGKRGDSALFRAGSRREVTFHNIADAADAGDAFAQSLMDGMAGHFAVAVNNLMHACDPGLFIIHGEYAGAGEFFLRRLREKAGALTLPRMKKNVRIEYSTMDDECSLTGGACFLADNYFANMLRD